MGPQNYVLWVFVVSTVLFCVSLVARKTHLTSVLLIVLPFQLLLAFFIGMTLVIELRMMWHVIASAVLSS
jgi:hypothetical protein